MQMPYHLCIEFIQKAIDDAELSGWEGALTFLSQSRMYIAFYCEANDLPQEFGEEALNIYYRYLWD